MKLLLLLLFPLCLSAQPLLPKAVTFAWNHPTNRAGIVGYKLQWGDAGSFVVVGSNVVQYTVTNLLAGTNISVTVKSLSATYSSDSAELLVFHMPVYIERNTGSGWKIVQSNFFTQEVGDKSSLYRLRMDKPIR